MPISEEGCKNLVELLKITNLTIVGLSLALVSNVVLLTSYLRRNDIEEVRRARSLVSSTEHDSRSAYLTQIAAKHNAIQGSFYRCIVEERENKSNTLSLTFFVPTFLVVGEGVYASFSTKRFRDVHTVKELADWWNDYNHSRVVLIPKFPFRAFISWGYPDFPPAEEIKEPKVVPGQVSSSLACISPTLADAETQTLEFMVPRPTGGLGSTQTTTADRTAILRVQFSVTRVDFSPNEIFDKEPKSGGLREFSGIFTADFPALSSLEEKYTSYDMGLLERVLVAETAADQKFELFGAKIPADLVTKLGLPALVILQMQFASLCGFLARYTSGINLTQASRWSFLLEGIGFVLFAFGATIALPIVASAVSVGYSTNREWYWWLGFALLVFSSLHAGRQLSRLRRNVNMKDFG